ncbi:hypothetical protein N658DRAFT_247508 [Parathielavia hyrcaniae]|uniref:MARVEL domain-containing protein n=1 Tax=Parathielavia hyrcaniae TaxID=113614 RepID=A0AAN6Q8M4_9PEZI|nr:hypothetical protein N658DRAFT_247508 [Parathielavia hyrcaniae]
MQKLQLLLRAIQLLFIIILTGLIGNVIARNINAAGSATAAINFTMFVIALAWVVTLLGLATSLVERLRTPALGLALLAADALAALFTLISAIVLSAKLRAVDCGDTEDRANDWIAYGSSDDEARCRKVQASTVFMWFLFATFLASLLMSLLAFRRGGGSGRSSGPTMSQVRV